MLGLSDIAWYVSDIEECALHLQRRGIRTRDQNGNEIREGIITGSNLVSDCHMIWTLPEETGFTYEFYEMGSRHWPKYSQRADPRLDPGWVPDRVNPLDPLGIVTSSHHCIATQDLPRALKFYVDVLGANKSRSVTHRK